MTEKQPTHRLNSQTKTVSLLLGCFSILIPGIVFAQVPNPSEGDTVGKYCSSGVCNSGTGPTLTPANYTSMAATPIGHIKLSQPCIGNNCNNIKQVTQLGKIGIQDSLACLTEFKHHINSTCLPYDILKQFDNTNPIFSGLWVDQPYEHRLKPKVKNHENFNPNPWVIMVDPNPDFTLNAKMIYVVDKSFTWINPDDTSVKGLLMKTHVDRFVTIDCNEATVAPSIPLINDTIHYLESGCTSTSYNDTKPIIQKEIPFSMDTINIKQQQEIKSAKSITANCITHKCETKKSALAKW